MKLTSLKVGKKRAKVKSETTKAWKKEPYYAHVHSSLAKGLGYNVPEGFNGLVIINLNVNNLK